MGWYIVRGCLYGSGRDVAYFRDLGEFERHTRRHHGTMDGREARRRRRHSVLE